MRARTGSNIGVMYDRIRHYRARHTIADHAAVVQNDQTPAASHHLFEIVFYQHDSNTSCVDRRDGLDLSRRLGLVQARKRLVEQHDSRIDGERARYLQTLHLAE